MTHRVVAQLARTTGTAPCSRCLDTVAVTAGAWHAAEVDRPERAVCARCAALDDPGGWAQVLAWRRAARPTRISTRSSPRAPWAS
jgi:hypothetical protein